MVSVTSRLRGGKRPYQRQRLATAILVVVVVGVLYGVLGPRHYYGYYGNDGSVVVEHLLLENNNSSNNNAKERPAVGTVDDKTKNEQANNNDAALAVQEQQTSPPVVTINTSRVNCGGHFAKSCADCTDEVKGASWCNGDCVWIMVRPSTKQECLPLDRINASNKVICGGHAANSCSACIEGAPTDRPESWCNGDCVWKQGTCQAKPSLIHPAYNSLIGGSFQEARTERGEKVNVILVKQPMARHEKLLMEKYRHDILFLGISSFEAYPLSSPNPFSANFSNDEYRGLFDGFLTMMHEPEAYFETSKTKYLLLSQSDFNLQHGERFSKKYETVLPKKYDFVYSGTDQNVDADCVGWASFAKNWTFMVEALHVMCSDEFNLTGVLIATKNKADTKACWIPDSCRGKIVQTTFIPNQTAFFEYTLQSHFMIVPQIYDASPRVASQSLSLNVPVLMNRNILGGWKYVNNATGEFFHDMSDFKQQLRKIVDRSRQGNHYHARDWVVANYGNEKAGLKFRKWVKEEFPGRVKFPPDSRLLMPWSS